MGVAKPNPSQSLHDFIREATPAHVIGEYWYCAAKLWHRKGLGDIATPAKEAGKARHEELARVELDVLRITRKVKPDTVQGLMGEMRVQLKNALAARVRLVKGKERTLFLGVVPRIQSVGCPDVVDCTDGVNPVIIERKFPSVEPPERPWLDHQVQLGVYLLSIEALGFPQPKGIIRYETQKAMIREPIAEFEVRLDNRLREMVERGAYGARAILNDLEEPRPTSNAVKCRSCEYAPLCRWRRDRPGFSPPIFIDIETDLRGTFVWLVGLYSSAKGRLCQFFAFSPEEEASVLRRLVDLAAEDSKSPIICFSSSHFDRRLLRKRLESHRLNLECVERMIELGDRLKRTGVPITGGFKRTASREGFRFRVRMDGRAAAETYDRLLRSFDEKLRAQLLMYNTDDVLGLVHLGLKHPRALESGRGASAEDLEFLRQAYLTAGRLTVRRRERRDAEIKFRSPGKVTLDQLRQVLEKAGFVGRPSLDKGRPVVRMYGRQQISDFLKAMKLEEELRELNPDGRLVSA